MAIEIVDLPNTNGDFPQLFVCLPEGNTYNIIWFNDLPWYNNVPGYNDI